MKIRSNKTQAGIFDIFDDNKTKIGEVMKYSSYENGNYVKRADILFNEKTKIKDKVHNCILQKELKKYLKKLN